MKFGEGGASCRHDLRRTGYGAAGVLLFALAVFSTEILGQDRAVGFVLAKAVAQRRALSHQGAETCVAAHAAPQLRHG